MRILERIKERIRIGIEKEEEEEFVG